MWESSPLVRSGTWISTVIQYSCNRYVPDFSALATISSGWPFLNRSCLLMSGMAALAIASTGEKDLTRLALHQLSEQRFSPMIGQRGK